jgi:methylenetetrahydrofolate dehydrogenase (NADP+)/methenyltetrahydrofolate cyclohydrolase
MELMRRDATVTVCHSKTTPEELTRLCRQADFLFVAAGSPHLVTPDMVKPGAGVVNIGTTYKAGEPGTGSAPTLMPDVHPDVASVAGMYDMNFTYS